LTAAPQAAPAQAPVVKPVAPAKPKEMRSNVAEKTIVIPEFLKNK
jgi:hypothetical protein